MTDSTNKHPCRLTRCVALPETCACLSGTTPCDEADSNAQPERHLPQEAVQHFRSGLSGLLRGVCRRVPV